MAIFTGLIGMLNYQRATSMVHHEGHPVFQDIDKLLHDIDFLVEQMREQVDLTPSPWL